MITRPTYFRNHVAANRSAFTLVELLVSMALVIFIMLLMTQAFVAGLETFRQLKSLGDMDEKLRAAATLLKNDISAYHFEGARKLSDPTFFQNGPPAQGFVRIVQGSAVGSATYVQEGSDADSLPVFRAVDHSIHMTVKAPLDNNPKDFFVANISYDPSASTTWASLGSPDARYQAPGTYTSQWMEVAYFLQATRQSTPIDPGQNVTTPLPLYTLYRRQRLAVLPVYSSSSTDPANLVTGILKQLTTTAATLLNGATYTAYAEISCVPDATRGSIHFNSPTDLTVPENRFGGNAFNTAAPLTPVYNSLLTDATTNSWSSDVHGNDILLTDVLSFQIQVYDPTTTSFIDVPIPTYNTTFSGAGIRIFDTWSNGNAFNGTNYMNWAPTGNGAYGLPLGYAAGDPTAFKSIQAIKITVRLWDRGTTNTRQMTFVVGT